MCWWWSSKNLLKTWTLDWCIMGAINCDISFKTLQMHCCIYIAVTEMCLTDLLVMMVNLCWCFCGCYQTTKLHRENKNHTSHKNVRDKFRHLWLCFHIPMQPTTPCLFTSPTAQQQLSATCYSPDDPWGRPCLQLLPVWGEPEPAAPSGSHPATASGSHPGTRGLHAITQRSCPLRGCLQPLWETSTLRLLSPRTNIWVMLEEKYLDLVRLNVTQYIS